MNKISLKKLDDFLENTASIFEKYNKTSLNKPELENVDLSIKKNSLEFLYFLREFKTKLEHNFQKEDLTNFYNNMSSVVVRKMLLNIRGRGVYYPRLNEIDLPRKYSYKELIHELFHVASRCSKETSIILCGFFIYVNKTTNYGRSLNEGYTDNMTYKLFFKHKPIEEIITYVYEYLISVALEYIIEEEKMEKLYLNANLCGLIEKLSKYTNKEKIEEFIKNTDYASTSRILIYSQDLINDEKKKNLNIKREEITNFLLDIFIEKYKTDENFDDRLKEYKDLLTRELTRIDIKISITNSDYIDNYIEQKLIDNRMVV